MLADCTLQIIQYLLLLTYTSMKPKEGVSASVGPEALQRRRLARPYVQCIQAARALCICAFIDTPRGLSLFDRLQSAPEMLWTSGLCCHEIPVAR